MWDSVNDANIFLLKGLFIYTVLQKYPYDKVQVQKRIKLRIIQLNPISLSKLYLKRDINGPKHLVLYQEVSQVDLSVEHWVVGKSDSKSNR